MRPNLCENKEAVGGFNESITKMAVAAGAWHSHR